MYKNCHLKTTGRDAHYFQNSCSTPDNTEELHTDATIVQYCILQPNQKNNEYLLFTKVVDINNKLMLQKELIKYCMG